jgi:hypothetical protein
MPSILNNSFNTVRLKGPSVQITHRGGHGDFSVAQTRYLNTVDDYSLAPQAVSQVDQATWDANKYNSLVLRRVLLQVG